MKIVVNTISTKKHSGGAYQIACNFLMESLRHQDEIEWFYITSQDVDEIVGVYFSKLKDNRYFVFPTQPDIKGTYHHVKRVLSEWEDKYHPDVIYSISSPCYFTFRTPEVMRFANAWITNPNREAWKSMPWKKRMRMYLYRINQKRMLRHAKYIITQSETVRKGLLKITGLPKESVCVVPNVLPNVFKEAVVSKKLDEKWVDVNCAAAPVPHKNLDIIPEVLNVLKEKYNITNVRFHLTIPDGDPILNNILYRSSKIGMCANIVNHGRCTQQQLIPIYNQCSICFLSTLLETFSASSLEAMHFGQLIVATNYEFNREVIGDAGLYYTPASATDAADKIAEVIQKKGLQLELYKKMNERIICYNSYSEHFDKTVLFLKSIANR